MPISESVPVLAGPGRCRGSGATASRPAALARQAQDEGRVALRPAPRARPPIRILRRRLRRSREWGQERAGARAGRARAARMGVLTASAMRAPGSKVGIWRAVTAAAMAAGSAACSRATVV